MNSVSKLYKLKSWLTLNDAAKFLSLSLDEEVSVSDILHLALERHLKISVNIFTSIPAKKGKIVNILDSPVTILKRQKSGEITTHLPIQLNQSEPTDLELELQLLSGKTMREVFESCSKNFEKEVILGDEYCFAPLISRIDEERGVVFESEITDISGLWDLSMYAAEVGQIQEIYQLQTEGDYEAAYSLEGVWLTEGSGQIYCLQNRFKRLTECSDHKEFSDSSNFYPLERLPDNISIVVRRENIDEFLKILSKNSELGEGGEANNSASTQAHNSYRKVISTLAEIILDSSSITAADASTLIKAVEARGKALLITEKTLKKYLAEK